MRQVHVVTCDQRSVDLVFFVSGLPVATAELKTDYTRSVADAITQYKTSRLPKDRCDGVGDLKSVMWRGCWWPGRRG